MHKKLACFFFFILNTIEKKRTEKINKYLFKWKQLKIRGNNWKQVFHFIKEKKNPYLCVWKRCLLFFTIDARNIISLVTLVILVRTAVCPNKKKCCKKLVQKFWKKRINLSRVNKIEFCFLTEAIQSCLTIKSGRKVHQ